MVVVAVSMAVIKYPGQSNLRKKRFSLAYSSVGEEGQIESIMEGRHVYRSMSLAGHNLVTVREQRAINRKWS